MEIQRQPDIESWLFEEIRNEWSNEREGFHLSDTLAIKQAYWRKKKPMKATNDQIMYWASGVGHEGALLRIAGLEHGEAKQWNGIWYTPDVFRNFPIEIKTRRAWLAEEGKEKDTYEHYLLQLKRYCACENIKQGWLWVWCLVQKQDDYTTKPELACYRVEFTDEELSTEREYMTLLKGMFEAAIKLNNCVHLPNCPVWMCGKKNYITEQKPMCLTCKKEYATQKNIDKHLAGKGKGHEIIPAKVRIEYEKKCQWFDDCKPNL
jgi:hypothetical protein